MTIAVDFDGTIVDHRYPEIGKEKPFAIEALKRLQANGHTLILWSSREGQLLQDAVDWCSSRGLEFYAVNSERPTSFGGATVHRKIRVDMYIDDRNLGGLPDWPTIYKMVSHDQSWESILRHASEDEEDDEETEGLLTRLHRRVKSSRDKVNRR